jgi:PelA/Pel-15E family pectate lyase
MRIKLRTYAPVLLLLCQWGVLADPESDLHHQWRQPLQQDARWQPYFVHSAALQAQDEQQLATELKQLKRATATLPAKHAKFGFEPKPAPSFWQSAAAHQQAQVILSFQTPSGGWSKRTDMAAQQRQLGQQFGVEKNYIPTFDNGATSTQLRWLAAYYPQAEASLKPAVLQAISRGVAFVLAAQYPNGGFAQTYPLRGGYHDAITMNDGVMETLLRLLQDVATQSQFAMLPVALRKQAAQQFQLGIQLLLSSQLQLQGELTVWAAQYHPVELTPVAARAYEWPALVSTESAGITLLLMEQAPTPVIIQSVEAAVRWFERQQISGHKLQRDAKGARLVPSAGAKPLWARFYDLTTQQPLFVDRDGQRYADVSQLSVERQRGYGWYQSDAAKVLKAYPAWRQRLAHRPSSAQ